MLDVQAARRNERLLKWFSGLRATIVLMPVITVFMLGRGLNLTEILNIQVVYSVVMVLADMAGGRFVDQKSYRLGLILGAVLSTTGYSVYLFAYGFWPFAGAAVILGAGAALISGADKALLKDTLLEHPRNEPQTLGSAKSNARVDRWAYVGAGVAGAVVTTTALIGDIGGIVLVVIQMAIYSCLIPIAMMLTEPRRITPEGAPQFRTLWQVVRYAVHGNTEVRWLLLANTMLGAMSYVMLWLMQPYYLYIGIPLWLFGPLWIAQYAVTALSTGKVEWISRGGTYGVLVSLFLLGAECFALLGLFPLKAGSIGQAAFWIVLVGTFARLSGFWFIRAVSGPIMTAHVNELIPPGVRATVLSTQNTLSRLLYTGLGPFFGLLAEHVSLPFALDVAALLSIAGGVVLYRTAPLKLVRIM